MFNINFAKFLSVAVLQNTYKWLLSLFVGTILEGK